MTFPGQTSRIQKKEQVVAMPVLRLFGYEQGLSIGHEDSLLASGKILRVVTSHDSQSLQSRMVGGAIANTSFDA